MTDADQPRSPRWIARQLRPSLRIQFPQRCLGCCAESRIFALQKLSQDRDDAVLLIAGLGHGHDLPQRQSSAARDDRIVRLQQDDEIGDPAGSSTSDCTDDLAESGLGIGEQQKEWGQLRPV